jgi:hypothetical protein
MDDGWMLGGYSFADIEQRAPAKEKPPARNGRQVYGKFQSETAAFPLATFRRKILGFFAPESSYGRRWHDTTARDALAAA